MSYDFDVIVVGGGPGGYVAAIRLAQLGRRVCLVEREKLGGTCLNVGCIPAKTYVKSASLLSELRRAERFGIRCEGAAAAEIDMQSLAARREGVTKQLVSGVQGLLRANGVSVRTGKARFYDRHTLSLDGEKLTAAAFVLATGSENRLPASITVEEGTEILDNAGFFALDRVPESLAILGGGVVGMEFAYVMSSFGCKVSVVEMADRVLPLSDRELADLAKKRLEKAGVRFYLNAAITGLSPCCVRFTQNGEQKELHAEKLLSALGRKPRIEGLGLEEIGLEIRDGAVCCDDTLRTNLPHIFAVGDVNGKMMLAGTASHEGIVAAENLCGACRSVDYASIPVCAYMEPEIAGVGLTEEEARARFGDEIRVGRFPLLASGRALTEGETEGLFKLITDARYGEILGVHLYGSHATEMIGELALAIQMEATVDELLHLVHPHPTLSEAVGEAAMAAKTGRAIHAL
ncbi:MAG: dihydrolipoyl dehydrogenase [Oscillospiraceae bacterium]|nr:dihydrolipoyl dehydrogenase [Oscillospiraceae bacterium]